VSLFRPPVAARRYLAAATSGFILAGVLLPGAALAGPGTPPSPAPDTINASEGAVSTGNVLANDLNPGEGTLSVTGQGALSASVGTLVIAANGDYTFTPATNFFGTATTSYLVTNAKHTVSAVITINVANVNDAPTANNDSISVDEDVATDVTAAILSNDTDVDNDTLSVVSVSNVTGGSADVASGAVTFTGDADSCYPDGGSFDYVMTDGHGETSSASVTVTIDCVNDDPTAGDDTASGTEDIDVEVTDAALLSNESDSEGDPLEVTGVGNPTNGSVSLAAGVATFIPDADVCGPASAGFD